MENEQLSFTDFKSHMQRIEQHNGDEKYIEYYFYNKNGDLLSWIIKDCRKTRFNKNKQYQAAKGNKYIHCSTLKEAIQKAYELAIA
jgi:hypothetical protein